MATVCLVTDSTADISPRSCRVWI